VEILIRSLEAWLFGFVCAVPFIWNKRYIPRVLLSAFAPLAFELWLSWSLKGAWFAVFRDFKLTGGHVLAILGGLCSAHVVLVFARLRLRTERSRSIIHRLRNMPPILVVLLAPIAAATATYLYIAWASGEGFEWTTYFPIVVIAVAAVISIAWYRCFETPLVFWAAAAGGYFGSFLAAVYDDWDVIAVLASRHHYEHAISMLVQPSYFMFAAVGALAAGLMIGFSLIAVKLWPAEPVARSR